MTSIGPIHVTGSQISCCAPPSSHNNCFTSGFRAPLERGRIVNCFSSLKSSGLGTSEEVLKEDQKKVLQALLLDALQVLQQHKNQEFVKRLFSQLRSGDNETGGHEEPTPGSANLSSLRRLKVLDVHDYVHKSLRSSYIKKWLETRKVEECS